MIVMDDSRGMTEVRWQAIVGWNMDLRALLCFRTVAELGTISKASSHLRIAQPALTRQIQKLEHGLGVELLHRMHKGVRPTAAGQLLLDRTSRLEADLAEVRREVTNLSLQVAGALHLAVQAPLSTLLIPSLVSRFLKEHPGVALHVVEGYSADVTEGLLGEKLDVAIVDSPSHANGLTIMPLWVETLQLIGPPGPRLAGSADRKPVSLAEVGLLPLVLPTQRYALRRLIDAAFARAGMKARPTLEADGPAMIMAMVRAGLGYTLMPTCGCLAEIRADKLRVRETSPAIERPMAIVTRTSLLDELKVTTLIRLARAEAVGLMPGGRFGAVQLCPEHPDGRARPPAQGRTALRLVKGS